MTLSFWKIHFTAQEILDLTDDCTSLPAFQERFTALAEERSRMTSDADEHEMTPSTIQEILNRMTSDAEEQELYDPPTAVCVTHRRFIPCRRNGEHQYSRDPADIQAVRHHQETP